MGTNDFAGDPRLETLYTAILSDVMDDLGLPTRAMLPFVRPLDANRKFHGRARTGTYAPVYHRAPDHNPYEMEIRLIDDLKPGDVPVLACDGPSTRIAPWGELLSTAANCRGASGCVTDGLVRDTNAIRKMGFPVFHGGIAPLNSAGRAEIVAIDVPVICGGIPVSTGDFIFADDDGVVVIPQDRTREVIDIALDQVARENSTRDCLLDGMTLREVYDRYGVL